MNWKRWFFKCTCLSCTTVWMTLYMTRTVGTMYTDELNKELHISLPANFLHVFGVLGVANKPEPVSNPSSNNSNEPPSMPTFSQITSNQTNSNRELLTPEKLVEIKQHMSPDDKLKIYSLITSKVPQGDIQKISSLMEDGITSEKLNEIQNILKQYLNEQEYSDLTSIFGKY